MNHIKIRVTQEELNFIREALFNYYEDLNARFCEAEEEKLGAMPDFFKSSNTFDPVIKPKKPHWTQTPEGKKIMANRKPRGRTK
jgi:ribosomal protein L34